jgi:bacterioferritin-associated ferredoxin
MPIPYKINAEDLEEYFAALARCSETPMDDDLKLRELMRSYAELKFRIMGGSHCGICNAHVRHVIAVESHQSSNEIKQYECLCTRCFESEKAIAERMILHLGDNCVEVKLSKHRYAASNADAANSKKPQ